MTTPQILPLFPLHTVLFPGSTLPLRIFETRYIDMVRASLRESRPFGVVLIMQGGEVLSGEADFDATEFYPVGTTAEIVDTDLAADGMLHIDTQGLRRFRVNRSWVERDGLIQAEVTLLPIAHLTESAEAVDRLRSFLRRIMNADDSAPEPMQREDHRWDDPVWVVYRLVERLPIKFEDRQRVLGAERLDLTVRHLSAMIAAFE
ncbi:MAG: LON peptidase substrate-binding domain-containing protein [Halothiobacillus sp.]